MIQRMRRQNIDNPGAAHAVLYDEVFDSSSEAITKARVQIMAYLDVNFTINTYWAVSPIGVLREVRSDSYAAGSGGFVGPVHASLAITCVSKTNIAAGGGTNDYFAVVLTTVEDGVTTTVTKIFEYKKDANFVATTGRNTINVTDASSATDVSVITASAIASAFFPYLTVPVPTTAVLTATVSQSGARFALSATENVSNGGFSIGAPTSGVEGTVLRYDVLLAPGRNRVTLVPASAPVEFDVAVETRDDVNSGGVG
jgi:hypothetical protein